MNLISIVIPTYNRAHLLGETIESIQKQTHPYWECIVVDDNSTDGTEKLMKSIISKDTRVQYYKKPSTLPKGPSAARNFGFDKSKGKYINWFDSDDIMHPQKLEIDLETIQSGDYDFTISQSKFFSEIEKPKKEFWNETLWSEDPINDFITKRIGWSTNAPLWKRDSLNKYNLRFNEDLITAEDYLYHIQALQNRFAAVTIDKVMVFQRMHNQRLIDFKVKSPFKLQVNVYLMSRFRTLQLNDETIIYLNKQFKRQFANLLKNKEMQVAKTYYKEDILGMYFKSIRKDIKRMYTISLLYRFTGFGYRFIK